MSDADSQADSRPRHLSAEPPIHQEHDNVTRLTLQLRATPEQARRLQVEVEVGEQTRMYMLPVMRRIVQLHAELQRASASSSNNNDQTSAEIVPRGFHGDTHCASERNQLHAERDRQHCEPGPRKVDEHGGGQGQ